MIANQHILVAALDWGNGHQSRSTALINQLLDAQNVVEIACSSDQIEYWKTTFPKLKAHCILPDNKITWSKAGPLHLFLRFSTFKRNWKLEKEAIDELCKNKRFDLIVSDNRYGVRHSRIKSVLLTHQLRLGYSGFLGILGKWMISKLTKPFHEIWIPDISQSPRLSGKLSQSEWITQPVQFIGPLTPKVPTEVSANEVVLVLLSGPEPQRSAFAKCCINALKTTPNKVVIAGECQIENSNPTISLLGNISVQESMRLQACHKIILCRSGYTTLMELHRLNKKAILIPTPGQIEQTYLAKYWNAKFHYPTCRQKELTSQKIDLLLSQL